MHKATKIATCCYCGTRAALVLAGTKRHELACSSCGAPLHELKSLPVPESPRPRKKSAKRGQERPARVMEKPKKSPKKPKKSKRRFRMRDMFEEAFDVIEDLFD